MNKYQRRKELLLIPAETGLIKVHITGFYRLGDWGQVLAELNGIKVRVKGQHRKKTIIRSLSKLHETLLKQD